MFDKNEVVSIQITQNLIQDPNLTSDLAYIKSHLYLCQVAIVA